VTEKRTANPERARQGKRGTLLNFGGEILGSREEYPVLRPSLLKATIMGRGSKGVHVTGGTH